MTRKIYKFPLPLGDEVVAMLPAGARILCVGYQDDMPLDTILLWAIVDPDAPTRQHRIFVRGTGHPVGVAEEYPYIGTVHRPPLVWHVFDGGET